MQLKVTITYLTLIFLGLIIGLLFIEGALQIIQFAGDNRFFGLKPLRTTITWQKNDSLKRFLLTPDTQGWFVTPSKEYFNWVKSNKEGFYDIDHAIEKPADTFRILFIGDSFVASLQTPLEQTFFRQLEQHLNNLQQNKRIEVISMGLGDTGSVQQYQALQQFGLKYQPDLVVQMLLTANDLKNNSFTLQKDPFRTYFILQNNKLKEIPGQQKPITFRSKMKNIFKSSNFVQLALSVRQKIQENQANSQEPYPLDYHVYDINYNSDFNESWQTTQKIILSTKELVENNDGKYVLAVLANNEQVNKNVWKELENNYPQLKSQTDLKKPDKLLNEFCIPSNLNCLFMLPYFEEFYSNNPDKPTHYKFDGHWNEVGTKLATVFLIANLSKYIENNLTN